MKLSIIVPVYNMAADGKLEYCLDSLLGQTLREPYEILAVDDASTDNSLDILREYEKKHTDRIKVISYAKNRHQGGARNEGLKAAKGEWIGFLDSDDWVAPEYYERLIKRGEETGADVVGCTYSLVSEHTYTVGKVVKTNDAEQSGEITIEKRRRLLDNPGSMVTKVYRASLIRENGLSFPEDIFYEDNAAAPVWTMYYKHFEYIDEPLYYYYQHDASTVHTISLKRCLNRMAAGEIMLFEMKARGFYREYFDEIESVYTTIYFINTVFSYMRLKRGKKLFIIKHMRNRMLDEFPGFRDNKNYGRYMDEEQKKYVNILMDNPLRFYIQYSLLWLYRDLRAKLTGK